MGSSRFRQTYSSSSSSISSPSSLLLLCSPMEQGSISLTDSGSSSPPTTPLHHRHGHGLKFGRKIYFEDHSAAAPPRPNQGPPAPPASPASSKKGRGGGAGAVPGGGQPPRCQVEGCKVDLSDAKAYYSRHKVCGMHSKSPKVVVGGIEQRFCQQCSRFHQLTEFDQVKRSCRRRLAGHNERRRKPPPGSLLASRYGRLSSSVFENSSRLGGGFMMDFTAYPRHLARDAWSPTRTQTAGHGKHPLHHPWQSCAGNPPPPNLFLQGSTGGGGSSFPSPGIPPGECYTGVTADSTCALSLLSNQPWSSSRGHASALSVNEMLTQQEPTTAVPHGASLNHFPNASWGFKAGDGSGRIPSHLGLGPFSQPLGSHFPGELELSQQSRRPYMELDHSRSFDSSSQQMHWSL